MQAEASSPTQVAAFVQATLPKLEQLNTTHKSKLIQETQDKIHKLQEKMTKANLTLENLLKK